MRARLSCLIAFTVVACGRTPLDFATLDSIAQTTASHDATLDSSTALEADAAVDTSTAWDANVANDARVPHCAFAGFAPPVSYATTIDPFTLFVVDFTGDGSPDFVVSEIDGDDNTSEFFANNGDGAFRSAASTGASLNNFRGMAAADFNGDGLLDLASLAYPTPGTLVIDFGVAGGGFALQPVTYAAPQTFGYAVAGDFNGDGHPDLAVAGIDGVSVGGGLPVIRSEQFALDVYINAGDGTLKAPVTYATAITFLEGIATGDVNGDGHLDVVESSAIEPSDIGVFTNNGDGTFGSEVTYLASTTSYMYGLAVADFNGDGIDDVARAVTINANDAGQSNALEVFFGTPSGNFAAPVTYALAGGSQGIVAGDFNGDGHPDLAMVIMTRPGDQPNASQVFVFDNLGDGTFAAPVSYGINAAVYEQANAIGVGDFNGDGIADIAIATDIPDPPYTTGVAVVESICK